MALDGKHQSRGTSVTPESRRNKLRALTGGQGMTPEARADEARMEEQARRDEAHEHVRRLRLIALQLDLWDASTAQRVLRDTAASYERKWAEPERVA